MQLAHEFDTDVATLSPNLILVTTPVALASEDLGPDDFLMRMMVY